MTYSHELARVMLALPCLCYSFRQPLPEIA
jgi:hypothetical protein